MVFLRNYLNCFRTHSTNQLNSVEGMRDCHKYNATFGHNLLLYIWSISSTLCVPPAFLKKSRYSSTNCSRGSRSQLTLRPAVLRFMIAYDLATIYLCICWITWFLITIENASKLQLAAIGFRPNFLMIIFSSQWGDCQAFSLYLYCWAVVFLFGCSWGWAYARVFRRARPYCYNWQ